MRKGRGKNAKRSYCLKALVDFRAAQAAGTADRTLVKKRQAKARRSVFQQSASDINFELT